MGYLDELEELAEEYDLEEDLERNLEYAELQDEFFSELKTAVGPGAAVDVMDAIEEDEYEEARQVLEEYSGSSGGAWTGE
ncbi:hypothetical protein [Natrinema altunense]|uniref:Uncharacterized protein n=1 Tax=Natrinema altunense (strain JCM 12890 / CGMCC 1.3731 / AJ2) TaxID=1227494 RepID=L9ZEP2_NATA2|nr:hypothetical protein [Natrinema altunense]ELY83653.1 hypothetical protein C485_17912 [Natrinema altunense JCM 12890]